MMEAMGNSVVAAGNKLKIRMYTDSLLRRLDRKSARPVAPRHGERSSCLWRNPRERSCSPRAYWPNAGQFCSRVWTLAADAGTMATAARKTRRRKRTAPTLREAFDVALTEDQSSLDQYLK